MSPEHLHSSSCSWPTLRGVACTIIGSKFTTLQLTRAHTGTKASVETMSSLLLAKSIIAITHYSYHINL